MLCNCVSAVTATGRCCVGPNYLTLLAAGDQLLAAVQRRLLAAAADRGLLAAGALAMAPGERRSPGSFRGSRGPVIAGEARFSSPGRALALAPLRG